MPKACYSHDKRSKKLFHIGLEAYGKSFFASFFSKKEVLPSYNAGGHRNWCNAGNVNGLITLLAWLHPG